MNGVLILIAVVCSMAALLVAVAVQRRSRHRLDDLMERLEELEQERCATAAEALTIPGSGQAQTDILAGRTTWIHRVLSGDTSLLSLAEQAVHQVHRHLEEPYTPSELAEDLCVSLRTLERGISVSLGCSPGQLILALKMREAFRLLSTGELRVNEVAFRMGFADPAHFSRRFKTFWRTSPSHIASGAPILNQQQTAGSGGATGYRN